MCLPKNWSPYCFSPMMAKKSAHSSCVHSDIIVSGSLSPLLYPPYVVGVCSFEDRPSLSVGEVSEPWTGELALMLLSYSSSASASDSG